MEKEPEYRKEVVLSEEERIDKSLDPDSRRLNDKGADLLSLGKLDQALLIFQEALTIDPNNFRAILNIGQVYKIQGQMEMATESCDKALEIIPDYLDALIVKASILMYKKEYDNALELYDQILGINPNHSKSKFSKGIIYEATEQFDKALKIYEGILKDNPNNWEAQKLRDRAKLELKGLKGEEMLQALEKVNEE